MGRFIRLFPTGPASTPPSLGSTPSRLGRSLAGVPPRGVKHPACIWLDASRVVEVLSGYLAMTTVHERFAGTTPQAPILQGMDLNAHVARLTPTATRHCSQPCQQLCTGGSCLAPLLGLSLLRRPYAPLVQGGVPLGESTFVVLFPPFQSGFRNQFCQFNCVVAGGQPMSHSGPWWPRPTDDKINRPVGRASCLYGYTIRRLRFRLDRAIFGLVN